MLGKFSAEVTPVSQETPQTGEGGHTEAATDKPEAKQPVSKGEMLQRLEGYEDIIDQEGVVQGVDTFIKETEKLVSGGNLALEEASRLLVLIREATAQLYREGGGFGSPEFEKLMADMEKRKAFERLDRVKEGLEAIKEKENEKQVSVAVAEHKVAEAYKKEETPKMEIPPAASMPETTRRKLDSIYGPPKKGFMERIKSFFGK